MDRARIVHAPQPVHCGRAVCDGDFVRVGAWTIELRRLSAASVRPQWHPGDDVRRNRGIYDRRILVDTVAPRRDQSFLALVAARATAHEPPCDVKRSMLRR